MGSIPVINFHMLNHPCIPGINLIWSWWTFPLISCWIWFASILLRIFTSIFIQDIGLFYSYDVFAWLWCHGNAGFTEWVRNFSFFSFLKEYKKDWCWFFSECLVVFTSDITWSYAFLFWEVFDVWFNLLISYRSVQIFCFFMIPSCWLHVSRDLSISYLSIHLGARYTIVHCTLLNLFISVKLVVMSLLSFLILVTWLFSLFFLSV